MIIRCPSCDHQLGVAVPSRLLHHSDGSHTVEAVRRWTVFAKYDIDDDPYEDTLEYEHVEAETAEAAVAAIREQDGFDEWAWDVYAIEERV